MTNAPPLTTDPLCPECTATIGHDDACPVPLREARNQRNEANIAAEAFAADRDRLARENAELRTELEDVQGECDRAVERDAARAEVADWKAKYKALASVDVLGLRDERDDLRHRVAESAARIATLEAALRDIRYELTPPVDRKNWKPLCAVDKAQAIAGAALGGGGA